MKREQTEFYEWDDAFKAGCRIVFKAFRAGDVEDDLQLSRLVAMALLVGADPRWVTEMIDLGCDDRIENLIKRRVH